MPPKKLAVESKTPTPKSEFFRIQATMPQSMSDFLEQLGSTCKKQHGFKLSKCEIIRALIAALQTVHGSIDLIEVKSEETLSERIREAFAKTAPKKK